MQTIFHKFVFIEIFFFILHNISLICTLIIFIIFCLQFLVFMEHCSGLRLNYNVRTWNERTCYTLIGLQNRGNRTMLMVSSGCLINFLVILSNVVRLAKCKTVCRRCGLFRNMNFAKICFNLCYHIFNEFQLVQKPHENFIWQLDMFNFCTCEL